ncbi:MAG: hypothetical protein K9J17_08130 [Flavobacteriales bacterium]|nr:hypothetical protein [Flavobacteriales bacterium]
MSGSNWKHLNLVVCILVISCSSPKHQVSENELESEKSEYIKTNPLYTSLSGKYMVEVDDYENGLDSEIYSLKDDGTATWEHRSKAANGSTQTNVKKDGYWSATEEKIEIFINGNSGTISERFTLEHGTYRSESRILKKSN